MWSIFRKIPHPSYGYYGGAYNKCEGTACPLPIDWMDKAFQEHDEDLKKGDKKADKNLGIKLRAGDKKKLKGWYARIYLEVSKIIFRP